MGVSGLRKSGECRQCGASLKGLKTANCYCRDCLPEPSHPEYRPHRARLKRYGIDMQMWNAMFFEQDGKCAISICTEEATRLDHNHLTGKPRAILCHRCNVALAPLEDRDWRIYADAYLDQHG